MSRKDEIEDKAIDFRHSILYLKSARDMVVAYKSFKSGAEWADATMLDKVCEWLKENVRVFQKEDIGDFILANLRKEMMK